MAIPPAVDPNKPPSIIGTPAPGLTYNPLTPEKAKQLYDEWQAMTPYERDAATRNQAAAIAAQDRANERKAQQKAMADARIQAKRDKYHEGLELQKRLAREDTKIKRDANTAATKAQQARVLAGQGLRQRRMDALKNQRAREHATLIKQKQNKAERDAILRKNTMAKHAADAAKARQKATAFRSGVAGGKAFGASQAQKYFTGQGAKYAPYAKTVSDEIRELVAQLNPSDTVDRSEFGAVGEQVYNRLLNQGRTQATAALRPQFGVGFEQRLLPNTAINPAIQSLQREHFGEAQEYIDNLLKRGVIQQTGYNKALQNLQGQQGAVNVQLQDIGNDILAGGRQDLTDIGNQAGLAAGNLALGQGFNPNQYKNQTAQAIASFNQKLPGALKTQVQGPLFDTTNLATIAGKAQGNQNTVFNPYALQNTTQPKNPLFDPAVGMKSVF